MAAAGKYQADADAILAHLHDNGWDLWTTPDKRLFKGAPFSALESPLFLLELGMNPCDPLLKDIAELFFSVWRSDGRFQVYPKGSVYPCQTILAADLLCRMGYSSDDRLQKLSATSYIRNTGTEAGAAINSVTVGIRKPNIPTPSPP